MANSRHLIPFIFRHENYIGDSDMQLPFEQLFAKAKAQGLVILPDDKGGPTLCGITMATYNEYCKNMGKPRVNVGTFMQMGADDWLAVFDNLFWRKCNGDAIENQAVADMIVDWSWTSGVYARKRVQKVVGAYQDGIIGSKTIAALNRAAKGHRFLERLAGERIAYYVGIGDGEPSQVKFVGGWINRVFDCLQWK